MTQAEFIDAMAEKLGKKRSDVNEMFAALASVVGDEMQKDGGLVVLPGLGRLKAGVRPARKGRNPRTGEAIDIAEKRTVTFVGSTKG